PLAADIEAIARPYSKWLRTSCAASEVARDAAEAIIAARTAPGRIATLIVPGDVSWSNVIPSKNDLIARIPAVPKAPIPAIETVERAAAMLRSGLRTGLLIAGNALFGKGLATAGLIATSTGAKLFAPYPFTRMERGAGAAAVERLQYVLELAVEQLKGFRQLILVGASPPVSYFAYPDKNSVLTSPDCEIHTLARPGEDYVGALEALAAALSLHDTKFQSENAARPSLPSGEITLSGLA